jgi:hypothetical protein
LQLRRPGFIRRLCDSFDAFLGERSEEVAVVLNRVPPALDAEGRLTHTNAAEKSPKIAGNGLSSVIEYFEKVIRAFVEVDHRNIRHCCEKSPDAKIAR